MAYPTNDTFSSLIDEVITSLQGYGTDNDQVATLTQTLTSSGTSATVDDTSNISRGLIEIDQELIYVLSADQGLLQIAPWGRGYKGSVASSHTVYSQISVAPTWPRAVVAREINNTIRAVYPNLYAVATYDTTASPTQWQYTLPSTVDRILSVEWRWTNSVDGWMPIHGWEMQYSANVDDFASGKALFINEPLPAGCRIHVTYAKPPTLLVNAADLYTVSGLPASSRDVIVYGAASRLLPWQDTGRVPVETVPSDAQDTAKPVGNAVALAKEMRNLYATRLADEMRNLMNKYPPRAHKVR
jgi:hypothetical protein